MAFSSTLEITETGISCTWQRIDYSISEAADNIRNAGLPSRLAERLFLGE